MTVDMNVTGASARIRAVALGMMCAATWSVGVARAEAQEFMVFDRAVQVHGFGSQGFMVSDENNYLTMATSDGSAVFSDAGFNASTKLTQNLRVGMQIFTRNVGNLGQGRIGIDWAYADYKFTDTFGLRAGKVKTPMGLYNDTQDMEFLHTFALLPQSVYPLDLRDSTIAHTGVDAYGTFELEGAGQLSYVGFMGERRDTKHGGYPYLLRGVGINFEEYGGRQVGGDLRWQTPVSGLLVGAAHMTANITGTGTSTFFGPESPYEEHSNSDFTTQYFGQYQRGSLRLDAEFRRSYRDQQIFNGIARVETDARSWYTSAAYRVSRRLELGTYYSRFDLYANGIAGDVHDHVYDKVVAARVDITSRWNVKVEGHFMDGVGGSLYPNGFYAVDNPQGLTPRTNLLMVRTGFNF